MQFKTSALLLLASIASVIAQTPGEKLDDTIANISNDINSNINAATSIIGNIESGATSVIGDIQNGATSIVGEVKSYLTSVGNELENVLPTITAVPSDIDNWFSSIGNKVEDLQIPTIAWNDIKTGLYPTQVSQWVDSLPTNLRAEASNKLTEWANDVGDTSGSPNNGAIILGAVGAAGVLALALAL